MPLSLSLSPSRWYAQRNELNRKAGFDEIWFLSFIFFFYLKNKNLWTQLTIAEIPQMPFRHSRV